MTRIPQSQHGLVLAGLKATPSGWPAASLDPGSGRRQDTTSGRGPERRIHKSQGLYGFRGLPPTGRRNDGGDAVVPARRD
jgi:hypothetical protein